MKLINAHRTGEQCIICIENSDGKRINAEISRTDYNQLIVVLDNVPSIFDECFAPTLQSDSVDAEINYYGISSFITGYVVDNPNKWSSQGIVDILKEHLAGSKVKPVNEKMREALENIANPIEYLRKEAEKEGGILNGAMANQFSNDANFLKEMAKKALESALSTAPDDKFNL